MFLVFDKDKINSYLILLSTVVILFGIAFGMQTKNVIETSTNQTYENIVNSVGLDK